MKRRHRRAAAGGGGRGRHEQQGLPLRRRGEEGERSLGDRAGLLSGDDEERLRVRPDLEEEGDDAGRRAGLGGGVAQLASSGSAGCSRAVPTTIAGVATSSSE